jgi:uncharacterized protein YPO0396
MTSTQRGIDQFCLNRLQVINWGIFSGYHSITLSPNGSLITGASGSGKSSLLDAISLGFLAHNRRNFNASGDNTAMGSSASRRTVDKYVRGAWGEMQVGTTMRPIYLRPTGATWAAVALTYSTAAGEAVTGVVLRWFATGTAAKTDSRYYLQSGEHDIHDLCNQWAARGFDSKVFTESGWRGGDSESTYLSRLYTATGIMNSDSAQQLLGKAKSLKSVGSLDQFVRDFMLDEPASITEAAEALKQINPLVEARNILKVAQDKRNVLANIEELHERYVAESGRISVLDVVTPATVRDYIDHLRLAHIGPEIDRLTAEIDDLGEVETRLRGDRNRYEGQHRQLISQIAAANSEIEPLRAQRDVAEERLNQVSKAKASYDSAVERVGYPPIDNPDDFASLREDLLAEAEQIRTHINVAQTRYHDAIGTHHQMQGQWRSLSEELERVRHKRSALPASALDARTRIAAALGVAEEAIPYVAELMDLKENEQRWRIAVEKVLHAAGLTLLVPERHYQTTLRFVNAENMRSLVRLREAQHSGTVMEPAAHSLGGKLQLVDPTHECAPEASNFIANEGDFICVDGAEEFPGYARAVTDTGLTKTSRKSARKDDRRPITPSDWIFLGNIDLKIASLEQDLELAAEQLEMAHVAMEECQQKYEQAQDRLRDCEAIRAFTDWSEVNVETAQGDIDRIERQISALEQQNPDLVNLQNQAEELQCAAQAASENIGGVKERIGKLDERRTKLAGIEDLLKRKQLLAVPHATRTILDEYRATSNVELDLAEPGKLIATLNDRLDRERDRVYASRNQARSALQNIINTFDSQFEALPNDGSDFDDKTVDYVALCRSIDERELPEANRRMLSLITRQVPEAIGNLRFLADNEQENIGRQIAKVNNGLRAVEFNRGTRLSLHADVKILRAVEEFNTRVTAIYHRAAAVAAGDEKAIFDQYNEILQLRQKLSGALPEDRDWARDALDVRKRFQFYCVEENEAGDRVRTHSNSGTSSGGEQEKLMAFCLAGALSFNLSRSDTDDLRPVFAQLMLDEAFSKSDPQFAHQALSAFRKFGFQLVIVSTLQNANTIEPYVDSVVMVSKRTDATGSNPAASAAMLHISEFQGERDKYGQRTEMVR